MPHITFYRKYRSSTFNEIVGQEHIIKTLKNAIQFDRLAHAYIFSGPRGTGKTSTARIFAKAANAFKKSHQFETLSDPLSLKIAEGNCVDIIEIDAASNTGVDNIRDINEKINFTPVEAHYKIYIIDEAHMLSTGAFNALLKTLEEPPARVIFILATTEAHKIPITIHSRCQHHQFRNLTVSEIATQLKKIAEKEALSIDKTGVQLLAQNASGCMRDAISLLDQVYSFTGKTITQQDILKVLGTTDETQLQSLVEALFCGNDIGVSQQLESLLQNGANPVQLLSDLIQVIKNILWLHLKLDVAENYSEATRQFASSLLQHTSKKKLFDTLEHLAKTEMDLRWFSRPALLVHLRLLECTTKTSSVTPNKEQAPPENTPNTAPSPKPKEKIPHPSATPAPTPTPTQQESTQKSPPKPKKAPIPRPDTKPADANWKSILSLIKQKHHALYVILKDSVVQSLTSNTLSIKLQQEFKFFIEKLEEKETKALIEKLIEDVFNQTLSFSVSHAKNTPSSKANPTQPQAEPSEQAEPSQKTDAPKAPRQSDRQSKTINQIVALFEGTLQ